MSDTPKNWVDDFWAGNPTDRDPDAPMDLIGYRIDDIHDQLLMKGKATLVDEDGQVVGTITFHPLED